MKNLFVTLMLIAALMLTSLLGSGNQHDYGLKPNLTERRYDTLFINSDLLIQDRDSLILLPGTVVAFTGYYSIHVQGKIIAAGTEADSIIFTVTDTTSFSNMHSTSGGWNGIRFENTDSDNDTSYFSYCRFQFGKATGDSTNTDGGAIRISNYGNVRISNSLFTNNYAFLWGGGIHGFKADIVVEHTEFRNNFSGNDIPELYGVGGGMSFLQSAPVIRHCKFIGNTAWTVGGGLGFSLSEPELINCVFTGNFSRIGGAINFFNCNAGSTIANVLVNNNVSLFFGGGVSIIGGNIRLSNFTIVNNQSSMGGGLYANEYAFPSLYNSILWGNLGAEPNNPFGSQIWIWDVFSVPGFYHCNIQFGLTAFGGSTFSGEYLNCIESDPMFTDPGNSVFTLLTGSSCINAGTPDTSGLLLPDFDLLMNPRIIHGIIDIGAYEYDGPLTPALPGDANCDEQVNVLDVITLVNYIMGLSPQPFCFENADTDGNGLINLLDVIGTINIILQSKS